MSIQQLIFAVIYFALGTGLIFLAVLIVRDSARIRLNRVTSGMLFLAGLGPIFAALGTVISPYQTAAPLKESYIYNLFYIWELFFPAFLYFSWIFPFDRLAGRRNRWRMLIFVPHVFHVLLVLFLSDTDKILEFFTIAPGRGGFINSILEPIASVLAWLMIPIGLILHSHRNFFALVNLVYVILAVSYLFRGMKHVEAPRLRRQVRVIILGIHFSLGIYILISILPNLFTLQISDTLRDLLTAVSLAVGAGSIAWAIIRYQFLDIRLIVRQSLVYTVSSALLVGVYVVVITQLSDIMESIFGRSVPIVNVALIVVALILFQPINSRIDNIIKRMFIRDKTDYRNIMNQLSSRIINILDRAQLFRAVEETLRSSMMVNGVGFALYDDARQAYLYFSRWDAEGDRLANTDPMLGAIGQLKTPTFYDRIQTWRRGSALATMLQTGGVQLIVPLNDGKHLLGFVVLTDKFTGFRFSYEDITLLSTLANQMLVALTNVRLYRESLVKQRLEEEMNLARQIQMALLPETPPQGNGFSISAYSQPSRTVGGDFYDFVTTDESGSFAVVIADVSGKGMPAALLAAQIQAALRTEACNRRLVSDTITNVNRIISGLSSSSGKYATLFYGVYCPASREFEFSNAGHNFPVLMRSDGSHQFLSAGGTIVGAFNETSYEARRIKLEPNDVLFCYTDGLSEAQNHAQEEYGEHRILEYLKTHRQEPAEMIRDGILKQVGQFSATPNPEDDTTIVILKITDMS